MTRRDDVAVAPDDDAWLDAALRALAHPQRRALLRLVRDGEQAPSDLAEACGLSRPATSQHLKALRDAGLVGVRRAGGNRLYHARTERMAAVLASLDEFWAGRLTSLQAALAEDGLRERQR